MFHRTVKKASHVKKNQQCVRTALKDTIHSCSFVSLVFLESFPEIRRTNIFN